MALILLGIARFADDVVRAEINAMQTQATVFSQVLQLIPWGVFDRAVAAERANKGCRTLDARSHLAALLAGQMFDAYGLRDIEAVMAIHAASLRRRRIEPARRSTLSDANRGRTPKVFEAVVPALLAKLSPEPLAQTEKVLRLVDSTLIHPGAPAAEWARYEKRSVAARVHVVYDPACQAPVFFHLTAGNQHDIAVAKTQMPVTAGATYVFDRGYYDFGFWADLDAAGCRLVTRLKKNTKLTVKGERPIAGANGVPEGCILSDRIVALPQRLAASRKNPFCRDGREIVVHRDNDKPLRLFTNDLSSPPRQVAALYKKRWDIELFFRWIKQHLKIRRFHGYSENAVRLQITAAIILYIVMKIIHQTSKTNRSMHHVLAMLKETLFHRIDMLAVIHKAARPTQRPKPHPSPQLQFAV
jgi:hypothetical protein